MANMFFLIKIVLLLRKSKLLTNFLQNLQTQRSQFSHNVPNENSESSANLTILTN